MSTHHHDHHDHHGHAPHAHGQAQHLSGRKILGVTLLNATITISEIIGGLLSGSLSLLSDAMHNLSDTLSIVLSYIAHRIADRPKNERKTFGYKRAEILSAFLNALALSIISILLMFEALRRFQKPEPIETGLMLVVAVIGFVANLVSVFLLEKDSHHNLNIRSSYMHLLADTLSSVGVIVGGLVIRYIGWTWIDALLTFLIALYILKEAIEILKVSIDILMQASPKLNYIDIQNDIEALPHVRNIHHIHAWNMDEKNIYFEAHIDYEDRPLSSIQETQHEIEQLLKERYGIHHVTLQAECDSCHQKQLF